MGLRGCRLSSNRAVNDGVCHVKPDIGLICGKTGIEVLQFVRSGSQ
jgi:hypothetical protein